MSRRSYQPGRMAITIAMCILAVAGLLGFISSSSAVTRAAQPPSKDSRLPEVQLPAHAGLAELTGMSLITKGRAPLSGSKDGSGPYTASAYGFTGSLVQGLVIQSAIARYGTLSSKPPLPLPLPLAFASAHPGPVEVFVVVRSFSNTHAPGKLLLDPNFADTNAPGVIELHSGAVHGGLVWRVDSAANGGLGEFRFEWTNSRLLYGVSVIGARLTLAESRGVALKVGAK